MPRRLRGVSGHGGEGQRGRRMQNFRKRAIGKREVRQSRAVIGGNYDNSIPRARALAYTDVGARACALGGRVQVHGPPLRRKRRTEPVGSADFRPLLITQMARRRLEVSPAVIIAGKLRL